LFLASGYPVMTSHVAIGSCSLHTNGMENSAGRRIYFAYKLRLQNTGSLFIAPLLGGANIANASSP
jgi:hypothetical protein